MNTNKEITITEDQFVRTAAEAAEEASNNTNDPKIILGVAVVAALIAKKLFHAGGGRLMTMWRLNYDRRCTC